MRTKNLIPLLNMRKKTIILGLLLHLILAISLSSSIQAQSLSYKSPDNSFEISYDASFSISAYKLPNLVFALHNTQSNYPTFNVIRMPGQYGSTNSSHYELANQILSEYRLLGLTDAKLAKHEMKEVNGFLNLTALITYKQDNIEYVSKVAIYPLKDSHFILTYIDKHDHFLKTVATSEFLFSTFKLGPEVIPGNFSERQEAWSKARQAILLGATFLLFVLIFLLIKIRKSRPAGS